MKDAKGHGSESGAHSAGVEQVGKVPLMQARHFQMIADTLKQHAGQVQSTPEAHSALVNAFADNLAKSNPKFNRSMFVKASGSGSMGTWNGKKL